MGSSPCLHRSMNSFSFSSFSVLSLSLYPSLSSFMLCFPSALTPESPSPSTLFASLQVHPFFRVWPLTQSLFTEASSELCLWDTAAQSSPSSESMFFKDFDSKSGVLPGPIQAGLSSSTGVKYPSGNSEWLPPLPAHCDHLWWSVCFHFVASYHSVPLGVEPEFRLAVLLLAATMP